MYFFLSAICLRRYFFFRKKKKSLSLKISNKKNIRLVPSAKFWAFSTMVFLFYNCISAFLGLCPPPNFGLFQQWYFCFITVFRLLIGTAKPDFQTA